MESEIKENPIYIKPQGLCVGGMGVGGGGVFEKKHRHLFNIENIQYSEDELPWKMTIKIR